MEITKVKIIKTTKQLSNDKLAREDGLLVEFYNKNMEWISDKLLQVYREAMNRGSLGSNINKGINKLLIIGDKSLIRNWRLIILLNVSYKMLPNILAKRLVAIFPCFISKTQTHFYQR